MEKNMPDDIGAAVKRAVMSIWLNKKGITPDDVGTHSLRAGGAMALKINWASDTTIKKAGRWTSMAFLQYLHNQIGHFQPVFQRLWKRKSRLGISEVQLNGPTGWKKDRVPSTTKLVVDEVNFYIQIIYNEWESVSNKRKKC